MTHLVETDAEGRLVLPPEVLKMIKPQTRYKLEIVEAAEERQKVYEEWKQNWGALSAEISKVWPEGILRLILCLK